MITTLIQCYSKSPHDLDASIEQIDTLEATSKIIEPPKVPILYVKAKKTTFITPIFSQGIIEANRSMVVKMKASGELTQMSLTLGDYVKKGTLVARVDDQELQLEKKNLQIQLDKAIEDKNDLIYTGGGVSGVDSSVSKEKLNYYELASGFRQAKQALEKIEYLLSQTALYAPQSGLVSDLKVQIHQQVSAGEEICRLIDPASFLVSFQVLESEAVHIIIGETIEVSPAALPETKLKAKITTLDPKVSEEGLVTFKARLITRHKKLLEGMSMQVTIQKSIPNQLVVPKEALVLRSGREVIFVYDEESGLAKWKYVTVARENDEHLAISDGLVEGDLVIVEGNANLAHDAEVVIDN